jgi:hypothetical protein
MRDYDSQEELSDSEDPDLLSELQELDVDEESPKHQVRMKLCCGLAVSVSFY